MTSTLPGAPLAALHQSYLLSLAERELSRGYIEIHERTGPQLVTWLRTTCTPTSPAG